MKLTEVNISNFMAIGTASIALANRGLILIEGVNNDESSADSNGSGKSSIGDAISWCLYGVTARGEDGDKVVNRKDGKNCKVTVDAEDGDDVFRIARHRKHKTGKNSLTVSKLAKDGTITDLTKGTDKLTQELVNQILGCSYEVFCGAVYAGQERMPDLPGMTDKQLKMLIEEASGATLLEAAYQEANTRLRTKESDTASVKARLAWTREELERSKTELATAQSRQTGFNEKRNEQTINLLKEAVQVKRHAEAAKALLAARDKKALQDEIRGLEAAIIAVDGERAEERRLAEALDLANRQLTKAQAVYSAAQTSFTRDSDRLVGIDHKVGCPCETCDRPFSAEDIAPAKKLAEAQVAKSKAEQLAAFKSLEDAQKRAQSARDALDAFRATMTDLTATNALRASKQQELAKLVEQENGVTRLMAQYDQLVKQAKERNSEPNPYNEDVERAAKRIAELDAAVATISGDVASAETALEVQRAVAKVFSPAGVRAFLLDQVTPFLNSQTAKYLGTLSDGHISATWTTLVKSAKGDLREKFSIEVATTTGGDTFKGISGGEKRKVRIACALALQDLVARRASKPIDLFIGDEIDDALDEAGRERLMTILEEKAKERGSVFIISHSDIKDSFRNVITVTKDGGQSKVEEVMT